MTNINLVVNYNHRSLIEHLGSGKDWDLARRGGGIRVVSPYQTAYSSSVQFFSTHMEALKNMKEYISEIKEDYVVMMDSDYVCNINLADVLKTHVETGANITFVTKPVSKDYTSRTPKMMISSQNGKITDIALSSSYNSENPELSLNMFVTSTYNLQRIIEKADAYNLNSFTSMLLNTYKNSDYRTYCYNGFVASVSSFLDYYKYSIQLATDDEARASLLWKNEAPIFTKVNNSYPTVHTKDAKVKNSLVADECVIEGTVENSVIFRGVHVGKGAVVKNSVLFHGTYIADGAELNCIVTDKNVFVSENVKLSGNENMPFYVQKGRKV
jgi:glucose-1-phosphate adenylyltransferase